METDAFEQARLEQLHRLYYNLQHRILPEIILSEQVNDFLNPNPEGEGFLSEAGTTELAHMVEQAIAEEKLEKHIAEQEEKRNELEAYDFVDEAPDFLRDTNPENFGVEDEDFFEDDEFESDDNALENDFFGVDDEFASDEEDFADDLFDDEDLTSEEDEEEPTEQMLQLMAELDEMLDLHKVKAASSDPDENFLDNTWRRAWFDTALEQLPDHAGYTLRRINQRGCEIVLFTFPEPIEVIDAYMAAAIRKPGEPYRYYTLEATVGEAAENAVLAEWKAGGLHRNSGNTTTDVKNTEAFLEMIFEDLNYSY